MFASPDAVTRAHGSDFRQPIISRVPSDLYRGVAMEGLDNVELLPEPEDSRILSVVDSAVVGFQDQWRSEVTGWAPMQAVPVPRIRRRKMLVTNGVAFSVLVILLL